MQRRTLLKGTGPLIIGALAGCSTSGGGDSTMNGTGSTDANLNISMELPDSTRAGDATTVSITIQNPTAERRSFEDSVVFEDGTTRPVVAETVEAKETITVEVDPVTFDKPGGQLVELQQHDPAGTIDVLPPVHGIGDPAELSNGDLRVTLTSASFHPALHYTLSTGAGESETALLASPPGDVLAVVSFEFGNLSHSDVTIGPNVPTPATGERYTDAGGNSLANIDGIGGLPLEERSLPSGDSHEAWVVLGVPREQARQAVRFRYEDGNATVVWSTAPGSSTHALPQFEVTDQSLPDEVDIGTEPELSYEVTNTGDTTGTFRGIVQKRDYEVWQHEQTVAAEIASGESTTITVPISHHAVQPVDVRLHPASDIHDLTFEPASLELGDAFETPAPKTRISAESVIEANEISTQSSVTDPSSWQPPDGTRFVLIEIAVHRPDATFSDEVDANRFSVVHDGEPLDTLAPTFSNQIVAPVNGYELGNRHVSPDLHDTATGWLWYYLDEGVSVDDLTVRWDDGGAIARWNV